MAPAAAAGAGLAAVVPVLATVAVFAVLDAVASGELTEKRIAVINQGEERPEHSRRIALGRAEQGIGGDRALRPFGIVGADARLLLEKQRPQQEGLVVATNGLHLVEAVGLGGNPLMLTPDERPELPAAQGVAFTAVE